MSKIVSFRLSDSLALSAREKLGLKEDDYKEFTAQLNSTAYSLILRWLTDDRESGGDSNLPDLVDAVDELTLEFRELKQSLLLGATNNHDDGTRELEKERDRLEDRVSELLNEIDGYRLEINELKISLGAITP